MMKFIDQSTLEVIAGRGGNGIVSFRREARVAFGGPDGGDGGNGGSVYFQGSSGMNTLLALHIMKHVRGEDGESGGPKNMYGARGKDYIVNVPFGTLVFEGEKLLHDIVDDQKYLIVKGGRGGHGNTRFKSSKNSAPKISENGTFGETKHVRLELKVMADIGLVGKPSVGKSTLLGILSNAKPKIADYHFTTLVPQLGLVQHFDKSFVIADLPGLIEGASLGKGLGTRFLKHIERCKVIAFILDFGDLERNPIDEFEILKEELNSYNLKLLDKSFLVVANKMDLPDFEKNYKLFSKKYKDLPIVKISAIKKENIDKLKEEMYQTYLTAKNIVLEEQKDELFITLEDDFKITKLYEGMFEIEGTTIEEIYNKIPLTTYDNIIRFNKKVKDIGLWKALINEGIEKGDTVRILGYQFTWEDDGL
ncbi:MAG: GTPase ObgE [Mycoplasmataceae bacterium]|nr:GTPase ObgE [Mycoplasmataceae bacterium]